MEITIYLNKRHEDAAFQLLEKHNREMVARGLPETESLQEYLQFLVEIIIEMRTQKREVR